jgi:glyoxylase-like metal-dependent hydrolase (beta-lactamase superfamily II)
MTVALPEYEIFALRYATMARKRQEAFLAYDPHDGPMPIDYFVWVIRSPERSVLVDTGISAGASARRKRDYLRSPIDAIGRLGIKPGGVKDVTITHLHYDHVGNVHRLPRARLHIQERELQYANGRQMKFDLMRHAYVVPGRDRLVRSRYPVWQQDEPEIVLHKEPATPLDIPALRWSWCKSAKHQY